MNKKTIIWIVVVIAIIVIAYFTYNYFKNKRDQELLDAVTPGGTTPAVTLGPGTSSGFSDAFPLQVGSKGANVTAAQTALNMAGCLYGANISADGSYGPITAGAADTCLKGKPGHITGQITYAEFIYLKNKAAGTSTTGASGAGGTSTSGIQQIAINACATTNGKAWFESTYGTKCSAYGL